jgi:hypothetical protein
MGSDPLDPNYTFLVVNGDHQSIVIPFNVEHDAIRGYDTGRRILPLDLSCILPLCLLASQEDEVPPDQASKGAGVDEGLRDRAKRPRRAHTYSPGRNGACLTVARQGLRGSTRASSTLRESTS